MKVSLVLFLSVILMQVKVIYGESLEDDDQITTTVQPEAIPEDNVQENSVVSSNNNNKTKTSSTSLPSLIGNIVTHLGKNCFIFTTFIFSEFFLSTSATASRLQLTYVFCFLFI